MVDTVWLDDRADWRAIAAVAEGAPLALTPAARRRVADAAALVAALVERQTRGYGINTGVGALCDVVIDAERQQALSRNILMSHACGVGTPLGPVETRAIMAAQVANFSHGRSGVRPELVDALLALLEADILPLLPARGSVGYLTHGSAIGLVLIGQGVAMHHGQPVTGAAPMARIGRRPLVLGAKEGLSMVNGSPCATGLACVALARMERLLDWADAVAAMTYENLGCQADAFDERSLALRRSAGLQAVGARLRACLDGSAILAGRSGSRTQDALSLRAIPHVHGAARDLHAQAAATVNEELASVTDNPAVGGTPDAPEVWSEAHAVAASLGLAMDGLAISAAQLAALSERRIDRLVSPLVSGLPAFLATGGGVTSGYMIPQYTAVALVGECRRLAAPASLDGGITSAQQEDILTHATPAALKLLTVLDNLQQVLAIEALAATQAYDLQPHQQPRAAGTEALYRFVRSRVPAYADDRPMSGDLAAMADSLRLVPPAPPPMETKRVA